MKLFLGIYALLGGAAFFTSLLTGRHWSVRGPYRIGWEDDAPDQFLGSNGQPTGRAIELVKEAARRRGVALQWVRRNESSEAALRSGAVDLWPLMTTTPDRLKVLHISTPYVESVVSFVVLRDSHVSNVKQLSGKTVGYLALPINLKLARQYVPDAQFIGKKTPRDLIDSLCKQEIRAGFIEQDEVINDLINGVGCRDQGFVMISPPGSLIRLGIGSTPQARAAADAIRDEIDTMSAEGRLAEFFMRFGYIAGRSPASVETLLASRRRERWTQAAAALFALLFLLALWHTVRYRRERNRARRAEAALRRSVAESRQMEERLRLLAHALKSANDCITIADTQNRFLYVNDTFLRTYEYDASELIGQHVKMLHSLRADRAVGTYLSAAMMGESWRGELWNRSKSGREFPISLATSKVRDEEGRVIALVGVASDISERKQAEEEYKTLQEQYLQAQKLESIGRLAGGVAHDFNNLLTVINGYSDIILSSIRDEDPLKGPAEQVCLAGARAAVLTQQLLTFSRKQVVQLRPIDLNDVIIESKDMLRRLVGEDISLETALTTQRGSTMADSSQIHQVLMNLVVNARDAMPGGGRLLIETSLVEVGIADSGPRGIDPGSYLLLAVSDTGNGIDGETQRHIFEPFFTTKPPGKGTGLGLSTVYGIVKQNQGWIDVASEPGHGTVFRIYLPRIQSAVREDLPAGAQGCRFGGSETILVVEDQSSVRDLVWDVLASSGYKVLSAADGQEALALAQRHAGRIHAVLTDVVMPGMNGFDLVEGLKQVRPEIQALFMSGYAEDAIAPRGVLAPEIAYIAKPFTPESLLAWIRKSLDLVR
jgi:PAS domain S-box-containing protein